MVLRREYGATGSASHSGHSESFVIAACAAPGAIAAATALAPAAALESAARRLLDPSSHRGAARLAELVSHSSAGRTRLGASTAGAASSANTNTMRRVGVRRVLVLERARGDDTNAQEALAD
eukprot:scaffold116994_cov69-Phaeocystis_antarctica.AAC.5